jgi:hypothetical protein
MGRLGRKRENGEAERSGNEGKGMCVMGRRQVGGGVTGGGKGGQGGERSREKVVELRERSGEIGEEREGIKYLEYNTDF